MPAFEIIFLTVRYLWSTSTFFFQILYAVHIKRWTLRWTGKKCPSVKMRKKIVCLVLRICCMCSVLTLCVFTFCSHCWTRKLCYHKDDRAIHHIYGCPGNFQDSLTTPTANFPNFYGLFFRWYRPKERWWVPIGPPYIPLSALGWPKFYIAVLNGGCEPQILGKGRPCGVGIGTVRKSVSEFLYRPCIVTFPLSFRVSDILQLLFSSMPLFPYPTSSLPKIYFPTFPWE